MTPDLADIAVGILLGSICAALIFVRKSWVLLAFLAPLTISWFGFITHLQHQQMFIAILISFPLTSMVCYRFLPKPKAIAPKGWDVSDYGSGTDVGQTRNEFRCTERIERRKSRHTWPGCRLHSCSTYPKLI